MTLAKRTKYLIVLGDGMADTPRPELGGVTPLEYARTPSMDSLTAGTLGMVRTVPEGLPPGSDVANLSVMGYDPLRYYTGRSPLEAISMGVSLQDTDVAYRCNLVTLSETEGYADKEMVDYAAGEIGTAEARELLEAVNSALGSEAIKFYPGISYRHLMVWADGPEQGKLTPPHDIIGRGIGPYLPDGEGAPELLSLMQKSWHVLQDHPVNGRRAENGKHPANSIWLWGQGRKPSLPPFSSLYRIEGGVISAVDLLKGIGMCAGMSVIEVEGATGNIHTNFRGKAEAALSALADGLDFVYLHVEAPDEAGHQGDTDLKIRAIEAVDRVLADVLHGLREFISWRVMVLPDHPTPISLRTHTADPVPYAFADDSIGGRGIKYCERTAAATGLLYPSGVSCLKHFLGIE